MLRGPRNSVFSYNRLKVKLRVVLTGVMVIYYAVNIMTITCSLMFGHVIDTIIIVLSDKAWFY